MPVSRGLTRPAAWVVFLVFLVGTAAAQEVPKLKLRLKEETPVPSEAVGSVLGPIKCDSRGNLYLRPGQYQRAFTTPVVKISPDGKRAAVFSLSDVQGFEEADLLDFAVGPRQELYAVVEKYEEDTIEVHIVDFGEDGSHPAATRLDPLFYARQLVVLADGRFFIAGSKPIEEPEETPEPEGQPREIEPEPVEPYTAIFDRSGRVVTELTFADDSELEDPAGAKKPTRGVPEAALSLGRALSGEDGNIYLMRRTLKPMIYVISPAGALLRTLQVTPPGEKARLVDMRTASAGRLLFRFAEERQPGRYNLAASTFSLVDAETGERLYDYQREPDVLGFFVCYADNTFTFLGTAPNSRSILRRAVPR